MKRSLVALLFLLLSLPVFSQYKNNIWCFGDSARIDFINTSSPIVSYSNAHGRGAFVTIADSSNDLLFYAYSAIFYINTIVLNSANDTMANSHLLKGNGTYANLCIIPFAKQKNEFYLFHNGLSGSYDTLYYSVINMNLDSGRGAVAIRNQPLIAGRTSDCISAIKHGNGRDWWLITKPSDNSLPFFNRFYVSLIANDSIYPKSTQSFNTSSDIDFQKIIFNSDGNKLMLINLRGFMAQYDFDRCTGLLSNEQIIFAEQSSNFNRLFWEGAYSPNDSIFYVNTSAYSGFSSQSNLVQYNLYSSNITLSADTLDIQYSPVGTGAVRLAPNGKIYVARAYEGNYFLYPDSVRNYVNENLSVINNPNALGAACNYQPFSFYLGGKRTYYGLPNNPNYGLEALAGSACDTLHLGLTEPQFIGEEVKLRINPNPVGFYFNINYDLNARDNALFVLYDSFGNEVLRRNLSCAMKTSLVRCDELVNGVYYYTSTVRNNIVDRGKVIVVK